MGPHAIQYKTGWTDLPLFSYMAPDLLFGLPVLSERVSERMNA